MNSASTQQPTAKLHALSKRSLPLPKQLLHSQPPQQRAHQMARLLQLQLPQLSPSVLLEAQR
jgi:hypothetical protein